MNKYIWGVGALIAVGLFAWWQTPATKQEGRDDSTKQKVTVFKSPECGCCVKHSAVLRRHGFKVEVNSTENTTAIKKRHGISRAMESCHTAIVGDYFVEGHVPMAAIDKLLEEKPDIDGIALPGMPAGSPGMPGLKSGPFEIYGIKDGAVTKFLTI